MGAGPAAYDELVSYLCARDNADRAVAAGMRTEVYGNAPGGGVVVLLHGMTASPPAWHSVAEALYARGRTVIVPRLLLHGHADRMTGALRGLTAEALVRDTSEIVARACALGEPVTIAGHSLGGTLAIDIAARGPHVARAVAVAPFMGIANVPHELHPMLVRVLGKRPNVFLWWDPRVRERQMPAHGYPRYPLRALLTGMAIADLAREDAHRPPQARAIDIVLNAAETSVNNRTAARFAEDWRAAGASIAVHRIRGLEPSHDIIDPARPMSARAFETIVEIIDSEHAPGDREYVVESVRRA